MRFGTSERHLRGSCPSHIFALVGRTGRASSRVRSAKNLAVVAPYECAHRSSGHRPIQILAPSQTPATAPPQPCNASCKVASSGGIRKYQLPHKFENRDIVSSNRTGLWRHTNRSPRRGDTISGKRIFGRRDKGHIGAIQDPDRASRDRSHVETIPQPSEMWALFRLYTEMNYSVESITYGWWVMQGSNLRPAD